LEYWKKLDDTRESTRRGEKEVRPGRAEGRQGRKVKEGRRRKKRMADRKGGRQAGRKVEEGR
jgi:hypothetical protein